MDQVVAPPVPEPRVAAEQTLAEPTHADHTQAEASAPVRVPWWQRLRRLPPVLVDPLGLVALTFVSFLLRLEGQHVWFWIDEGLSVGISSHPLRQIPTVLRQDGNPPLYYLLLHGWINVFGRSEVETHALSLVFSLLVVPVAFWAGRTLFGRKAGWVAALLAATNPFLAFYSRETRMYSLLMLLGVFTAACFLHGFAYRHRRYVPAFGVGLALLLYTHNWSLFAAAGFAAAVLPCLVLSPDRRRTAADAVAGFGVALVLYLPWVPTLLSQTRQTGAPFSPTPILRQAISAVGLVLGDERTLVVLFLCAGTGLIALLARPTSRDAAAAIAMATALVVTLATAWTMSQFKPAWADRYFGTLFASLLIIATLGLSRAGRLGLVGLLLVLVFWTKPLARVAGIRTVPHLSEKSNVKAVATIFGPWLVPHDLVISTQMEQVPLLHYYLPPDVPVRYATPMGPVADVGVADWRGATDKMLAATPERNLSPLLADLPVGNHVLLVCPRVVTTTKDRAWFRAMDQRCRDWREALSSDSRFELLAGPAPSLELAQPGTSMFATLFTKNNE